MFFKDADKPLIRILKERGLMFRSERYLHSYPFGWRTGDPIIYYAKNAWYIRTSDYRDRMVELNKTIKWVPETYSRRPIRKLARKQCRLGSVTRAVLGHAVAGMDRRGG